MGDRPRVVADGCFIGVQTRWGGGQAGDVRRHDDGERRNGGSVSYRGLSRDSSGGQSDGPTTGSASADNQSGGTEQREGQAGYRQTR
jgi:hypothetical protein